MSSARYLAKLGNETTTGHISSATATVWDGNVPLVRSGDLAWCDECEDNFEICGTYTGFWEDGHFVGDGDQVLCHCDDNYVIAFSGFFGERQPGITPAVATRQAKPAVSAEPVQYAQTAKATPAPIPKAPPAALPLPARIYTTQRIMDDYNAKDMHYGDLSEEELKERFGLKDVSAKVNPYTLTLAPSAPASPYGGFYPGSLTESQPVVVSREESARIMFDEFRELARVFSFQGDFQNAIMEMITHMQGNSGSPYSSPLLDKALKEQILNDRSEKSSLLMIKTVLDKEINYEYGIIPLAKKEDFETQIKDSVLPKFNRLNDYTNGLVVTVHDTWATYITLESLEVTGNNYRAKVHYRIQDHFGLDDADILNPVFHQGRIFRIWFVLQRYVKYGYRPFITEMNATVEISGRRGG